MKFLLALLLLCVSLPGIAATPAIPRPLELQPDVDFWIRVYSGISTDAGFIHDQRDLRVVYETLQFAPGIAPRQRQALVDEARKRYQDMLRYLSGGGSPRNAEEQRVRDLWPATASPARLAQAVDDVRFQLGQSDRFLEGLRRAGTWEAHIAQTLAGLGLPPEIAALPHVESSFNPAAYSKVGAAGLWQFMRSTGRRFLRIDATVDERMDPFRATEAAAQLLSYNYRVLGNWPLALTAYNHGAEGMRRARDQMGTDDIVRIVREHSSPSFGFASRNFYVSFLAALTIDRDPGKYFGEFATEPEAHFQEVELSATASMAAIEKAVGAPRAELRKLNPALLAAVWNGSRPVPRGYRLRLPAGGETWSAELLTRRIGGAPPPPTVTLDRGSYYVVQRGDTLEGIAKQTGVPIGNLLARNTLRDQNYIYEGQRLQLAAAGGATTAEPPATRAATAAAVGEAAAETARAGVAATAPPAEPVSAAEASEQSPTLVPGTAMPVSADAIDYAVQANDTIRVAAAETIGHYADWLGLSAARLRELNGLRFGAPVLLGRALKLDFSRVDRAQFEQRRRAWHQQLQAEYFAVNRITGTEVYVTRRSDSLWSLTQRNARMPIWLLQQYNPDVDFNALRPGTQIVLPRVEARPDV